MMLARIAQLPIAPRVVVVALAVAFGVSASACKRRPSRCEQEENPPEQPASARNPHSRPTGALTAEDLAAFSRFRDDVRSAATLTVYEGLPGTLEDCGELHERELASKRTIEVRSHRFFERPVAVNAEAAATLLNAATSTSTFRAWRAFKGCGGFHPDFALVWKAGEKTYELLLCFGCQEAKLSGEGVDLWFDIVSPVTFGPTLEPLRVHRRSMPSAVAPAASGARP